MGALADHFHFIAGDDLELDAAAIDLGDFGLGGDAVADRGRREMAKADARADDTLARLMNSRTAFSAAFSMKRIIMGVANTGGRIASLNWLAKRRG